jgi:hypothetical protein
MNTWNQMRERESKKREEKGDVISLNLYVYAYFTKQKKNDHDK